MFKGKKIHIIKFKVQTSMFKGKKPQTSKVKVVSLCHSVFFCEFIVYFEIYV